ncbi:helix-turn-helix domain-containing protein [Leptospira inadai]|nr:helix-turn-helix transcriptional regulator [Leptospira inadai]
MMKILREVQNITHEELSRRLDGIPIDYIIAIENGNKPMTYEFARKISNILDVPISLFLK